MKGLELLLKPFHGELNDEVTREAVTSLLYSYLNADIRVKEYYVLCDETNNTAPIIDAGQLRVVVAILENGCEEYIYYPITIGPEGENHDESTT